MIDINDSHDNSLLESKEVKELLAMDFWKWIYVSRNVSYNYPLFYRNYSVEGRRI